MDQERVFAMKLSQVYPLLVRKAERKGRQRAEVDRIICWLTGFARVGEFRQCGYKFGRWYDMIWMEKLIGGHGSAPLPVRPYEGGAPAETGEDGR